MTHSTHFIYGYMASDIWLSTILIVRKETRCRHIGYSYRLTARVLLYAPSHRQDNTYHSLCYTCRGALAGTKNCSKGPPLGINPTTHRTMSERSTSELRPAPSQVVQSSLLGTLPPSAGFQDQVGTCKATSHSSPFLTTKNTQCPRQTAHIAKVCPGHNAWTLSGHKHEYKYKQQWAQK